MTSEASKAVHELSLVLDLEHATELVLHRHRLRKPLTAFAARLLARRLALFVDPNRAAEVMIERAWLSIEPDWRHGLMLKSPSQAAFDESLIESLGGRVKVPLTDVTWSQFPSAFQGKDGGRWVSLNDYEDAKGRIMN